MRASSKTVLLVVATLAVQRLLGLPGSGWLAAAVLVPMPWVVGPPLMDLGRRWYALAFVIGLSWDLLFEPVVGPGVIAWSAAALAAWLGASLMVNRTIGGWFTFGLLGAAVFWSVRALALWPLGQPTAPVWRWIIASVIGTAVWCALVRGVIALDLPSRWRQYRARRLR